MAQVVKNLSAMHKTWVLSLGWEDPLEKGMVTHSIILAWRILCTGEPGRLQSIGLQRVGYNRATNTHPPTHSRASQVVLVVKNPPTNDIRDVGLILEEGNGNPLQYSCLENPMDRSLAGYSP